MLTKSHYAARKFVKRSFRRDYRQHMCGLCHALGDDYGLASRILTSHDVILLNLLTSAQMTTDPQNVVRRCPMNSRHKVNTNQDDGSRFAAAVAVELANISVQDDLEDSHGRDLKARFAARMLKGLLSEAESTFQSLDFDRTSLNQLNQNQRLAENDASLDPAQPTAAVSAALFVMTARIANLPENEQALAQIGASYGAYLYLSDAFRDYADDVASGAFNPLKIDQQDEIPQESLAMLHERLQRILATMRLALSELLLLRYETALHELLTEPIERLITQVDSLRQRPVKFRQWRWQDALRAAFFIMPEPEQGLVFSTGSGGGVDYTPPEEKQKRGFVQVPDQEKTKRGKKKRQARSSSSSHSNYDNTNTTSDSCYWCLIGCDNDICDDDNDRNRSGLCNGISCSGNDCEPCDDTCDNDDDSRGLFGCIGGDSCDGPDCDGCDGCDGLDGCDGCDGCST